MVEGHKMPMTILANSAVYRPDRVASAPMQRPCTYPTGHVRRDTPSCHVCRKWGDKVELLITACTLKAPLKRHLAFLRADRITTGYPIAVVHANVPTTAHASKRKEQLGNAPAYTHINAGHLHESCNSSSPRRFRIMYDFSFTASSANSCSLACDQATSTRVPVLHSKSSPDAIHKRQNGKTIKA